MSQNNLSPHNLSQVKLGFITGVLLGMSWNAYHAAKTGKKLNKPELKKSVRTLTEQLPGFIDNLIDEVWENSSKPSVSHRTLNHSTQKPNSIVSKFNKIFKITNSFK